MEVKRLALGDVEAELARTWRALERVPEDRFAWRPHEKSWTLIQLATHLARLPQWATRILAKDSFDLAAPLPPAPAPATGRAELLRFFDENAGALRAALERVTDADLAVEWKLRHGDRVLASHPRAVALRSMGLSHMAHHRGQLTVYLRLLGAPVPALYGPSADEK
jgi:uncharacterized damage-inducible protein DinB